MKKKLIYAALFSVLIMASLHLVGCGPETQSSDQIEQSKQSSIVDEITREVGMPTLTHFFEKKQLKDLYQKRDNPNLVCYAYLYSEQTGKLTFFCNCIGYGIPYATQYSSSEKWVNGSTSEYSHSAPQSEPNGLFPPSTAEGTWILMVNPNNLGDIKPIYVEPRVIVSPVKLAI